MAAPDTDPDDGPSDASAPSRDDEPLDAGESRPSPGRDPLTDRLSAGVAVAGLLLLATNQAPPLAAYGTVSVALACVGVGILVGLVAYRTLGPALLGPLWLATGTAAGLALVGLAVLFVADLYEADLAWAVSLGATVFGFGAAARAVRGVSE